MSTFVWQRGLRKMAMLALVGGALSTTPVQADTLDVNDARMRLLPGDKPAAGYFRLDNQGDQPVVLVGASSEAFGHIHLHRTVSQDGMASMEAVERLEVPAGEPVEFAPQGYHLMLMHPAQTLEVGDHADITLTFEKRSPLTVRFEAVPATAM